MPGGQGRSRRGVGRPWRTRLTGAALVLAGCGGAGPGRVPVPEIRETTCTHGLEAGLTAEALGFSLAFSAPGTPREPQEAEPFLEEAAGALALVDVTMATGAGDFLGVAGAPGCRVADDHAWVAGQPRRLLAKVPSAAAAARSAEGQRLLAVAHFPEARAAFQGALAHDRSPRPLPEARVGDAYAAEGRWGEAIAVYGELVDRFPWSFAARARLGWAYSQSGRAREAIAELGRALALRPTAGEVAARIKAEWLAELIPPVAPPASRRVAGGAGARAVWAARPVAGVPTPMVRDEAAAYATCKETFRTTPALRRIVTGRDMPTWLWSPAEESLCTLAWLGAYQRHRERGRPADDGLEGLWRLARQGSLDERSLFDVGARAHPHAPALLPDAAHERLFAFVAKHRARVREDANWLFR